MNIKKVACLVFLFCAVGFCKTFTNHDAQVLADSIEQSQSYDGADLAGLHINEINDAYLHLNRTEVPADEWVELKYMLSAWRDRTTQKIIRIMSTGDEPGLVEGARSLRAIHVNLTQREAQILVNLATNLEVGASTKREIALAIANSATPTPVARQAIGALGQDDVLRTLGPDPIPGIKAYKKSKYKAMKWLDLPGFDQYEFLDDDTVNYRGMTLKSGDLFLSDLSLPHDGLLGSFADPRPMFGHMTLFLVVRHEGKRIPAVLEIHEAGARLVPLVNYLSTSHTYYSEVYRLENPPADWGAKLSDATVAFLRDEPIGYDFQARDIPAGGVLPLDQRCATCPGVPLLMYKRTGVELDLPRSVINEGAKPNLGILGIRPMATILMPMDVARSGLKPIAVADNRMWEENLAREIVIGAADTPQSVGYHFAHENLDLNRLPRLSLGWKLMELAFAQDPGLKGRIARWAAGFRDGEIADKDSAPARTVAFYLTANDTVGPMVKAFAKCGTYLRELGESRTVSLEALETNQSIRNQVGDHVERSGLAGWYNPRPVSPPPGPNGNGHTP